MKLRWNPKNKLKRFYFLLIIFLLVVADQISKNIAWNFFPVICNYNISFGLSLGANLSLIISSLVVIIIGYFFYKEKNNILLFSYSLILSGGSSNIIDRLFVGCVRDFINLGFWPSFNLADSFVSTGAFVLIINLLKNKKNET